MAVAWLLTLPAAAVVGALKFWISHGIAAFSSALVGDIVTFLILLAASYYMWWRAQQQRVDANNVNADWDSTTNSVVPADVREARETAKGDKPKEPIA
jgi:inorganic phosphate transporter, PiT family